MPKWRVTTWLFVGWTFTIACLFVSLLIQNDLTYLDLLVVGVGALALWLVGAVPLVLLWAATDPH